MRLLKLLLFMFLYAAAPAVAGSLEDGVAAHVRGDYATALGLIRPLAEQGDIDAQVVLGQIYYQGQGVAQDYAMAMSWYRRAAEQGDSDAQYMMGRMYRSGQGVGQDYAIAITWYRKAAEQGDTDAQCMLGRMYQSGVGVSQDFVQAHKWLNLAAARLGASEKEKLDAALRERDALAAKMTPAQIEEAQKLAREWKPHPER